MKKKKAADKWAKPSKVDGLAVAFGPSNIDDLLPKRSEVPDDIKRSQWMDLVRRWFFLGLTKEQTRNLATKPGIDRADAFNHVRACMRSFEPQHQHKEEGVAWLMSKWFQECPTIAP